MKYLIIFFTAFIFNICLPSKVMGQFYQSYQDDVTGSVIISIPITINNNADMNFGNIQVGTTSGTVVLSPSGGRTRSGGVTLPAVTGTVQAASFTVTGNPNATYNISLPTSYIISNGLQTMTINSFTSTPSGSGLLSSLGAQDLNIGAKLKVAASQAPGTYTNPSGFSVTVNYP